MAHVDHLDRIPEFDGLRGIAVLLVVWAHLPLFAEQVWGGTFRGAAGFFLAGHLGVDLFFALSGYLITGQLMRLRSVGGARALASFQARRALRIFPLFYVVLAATAWILPDYDYLLPGLYLANYGFAVDLDPHPLRHAWSLAVEEQFYLLWPLVIFYAPEKHLAWIVGRLIPLIAVWASITIIVCAPQPLASAWVERGLESRMLTLALGASLVFTPATAAPLPGRWWIIAGALGLTHMLVHFSTPGIGTLLRHLGSVTISILVLDQFTRPCASPRISYFGNLLRTRLLIWVGTISYGLYLIHFPIFYLVFHEAVERGETASLPLVLAAITLVLILAWLAHLLIERPCARLRRRWGSQSPVAVVG